MKVLMAPDGRRSNPYQQLLVDSLTALGADVDLCDFPDGSFPMLRLVWRRRPAVLHVHWVNDLVAPVTWSKGRLKMSLRLVALWLDVRLAKMLGVRLVWTIHNFVSHESVDTKRELLARALLARCCDALLLHSESALKVIESAYGVNLRGKAHVAPHGNYDGCYPAVGTDHDHRPPVLHEDDGSVNILFFGAVRGYKGVARLLGLVRRLPALRCRVMVAGRPFDEESRTIVENAVRDDERISSLLGFVDDSQVAKLFAWADIVAVPFERTLSSGSVVLSLTMSRPVLVSAAARVLDIVDESNAIFFESDEDLEKSLLGLDKYTLALMRPHCRAMADKLTWKRTGELTLNAYRLG